MISKNNKIFLAGHNGMVGSAILKKLKSLGYKNIICVRICLYLLKTFVKNLKTVFLALCPVICLGWKGKEAEAFYIVIILGQDWIGKKLFALFEIRFCALICFIIRTTLY